MNRKVVEIIIRVSDVNEDDKFEEDTGYEAQSCLVFFDDEDAKEAAYTEADELADAIQRLVTM